MGLTDLQSHFTQSIPNTVESVDLLKIAHGARSKNRNEKFKLIVDGECCLDRLYGGYFPDWVCGGQWNKMEQFLRNFASVVQNSNLELLVILNGSLEPDRLETEWKRRQEETYRFVEEIQRHVNQKKKPPPKIWWVPPAYLRSAMRLAFRSLQMKTMCTLEDHHKEVVRLCQKNNFHGVVGDDSEYLVFDIPRYFSAQKLKLTFKGSLETVELKLKKIYDSLTLPREKFHVFTALLGSPLLSESDLSCFFSSLNVDSASKASAIEKVSEFVKGIPSCEIEKIAELICTTVAETEPEKAKYLSEKVLKCLRYYSDLNVPKAGNSISKDKKNKTKSSKKSEQKSQKSQTAPASPAVETVVESNGTVTIESNGTSIVESSDTITIDSNGAEIDSSALPSDSQKLEGDTTKIFAETETEVQPELSLVANGNTETVDTSDQTKSTLEKLLYRVNPEIETVCLNRHKNGLMSPYIYQIFKHKEIKLSGIIQTSKETNGNGIPNAHDLFRPLRQRVYAILFNLHHLQYLAKQRAEKVPIIEVKETYFCSQTKSIKTDVIQAVEVGWGVPTVERLWLGEKEDCKRKRTRAFLAIMKSDKPIVLDSTFVPQQMLVLTCVLRYILSSEKKVLRKNELEAFIAQAIIQDLTDPSIAQDIEVANLTMRGVHLSHLFMEGVEMAMLANDACGAPIPYMLFCPWLFFNGKVFNYVLEQQAQGKSLAEICGYKMDLVFNIDQLRLASTESIKVQYATTPNVGPWNSFGSNGPLMNPILAPQHRGQYIQGQLTPQGPASLTQLAAAAAVNRSRLMAHHALQSNHASYGMTGPSNVPMSGIYGNYPVSLGGGSSLATRGVPIYHDIPSRQQRRIPNRTSGGQLEVAGMVVGSWGANYGPTSLSLANNLGAGGRNMRIPMGPAGAFPNLQMNSLFDQIRISGGKIPNPGRPGAQQNLSWNQRKPSQPQRVQKKPPPKKETTKSTSNPSGSTKNSTNTSTKPKAVSFKQEELTIENGSGDAPQKVPTTDKVQLESNGNDGSESSPVAVEKGVVNEG